VCGEAAGPCPKPRVPLYEGFRNPYTFGKSERTENRNSWRSHMTASAGLRHSNTSFPFNSVRTGTSVVSKATRTSYIVLPPMAQCQVRYLLFFAVHKLKKIVCLFLQWLHKTFGIRGSYNELCLLANICSESWVLGSCGLQCCFHKPWTKSINWIKGSQNMVRGNVRYYTCI
jgi:hypothetical protein